MTQHPSLQLFGNKKVRTLWDDTYVKWYFSIVDVIQILTESTILKRYWSDLKKKLSKEGSELYDNLVQLKMPSAGSKNFILNAFDNK